ncbi:MAG: hypothetical protein ACJASB_000668 [Shewanella psychromarinicola]|jgi:hypothetical protein
MIFSVEIITEITSKDAVKIKVDVSITRQQNQILMQTIIKN